MQSRLSIVIGATFLGLGIASVVVNWVDFTPAPPVGSMEDARLSAHITEGIAGGDSPIHQYTADEAVTLSARLCPGLGQVLPPEPPLSAWIAGPKPPWKRVSVDPERLPPEDCHVWHWRGTAAQLWPDTSQGVVRWAIVAGRVTEADLADRGQLVALRQRGVPVVDGEAIRVDEHPITVH